MGVERERGSNQGVELPDLRLPIGLSVLEAQRFDRSNRARSFGLSLDDGLSPPSLAHAFKNFSAESTIFRARRSAAMP